MLHRRFRQIFGVIHQEQPATSQHNITWSILEHHKMRAAKAWPSWVLRSKISISEINKKKQKPSQYSLSPACDFFAPTPAAQHHSKQHDVLCAWRMLVIPSVFPQVFGSPTKFRCRINLWSLGAVAQHVRHLHDNPNVPLWLLPNLSTRFAQNESENVHKSDAIGKLRLQKVSKCPKMSHQKEQFRNHK